MELTYPISTPPDSAGLIMPRLFLAQEACDMIAAYTQAAAHTEVNGFAYVQAVDARTYYVANGEDVFITPQSTTMGSADVSEIDYALTVERAVREGRADLLRLQWHSHPGAAYFSPTDMNNIENLGITATWLISLVTNRHGEMRARFDTFRPVRFGAEMPVQLHKRAELHIVARAAKDVKTMVTVVRPPATTNAAVTPSEEQTK